MFLLILFGAFLNSATQGTIHYEECKSLDFKPKACWNSKQFYKSGKSLCEIQGKKFEGSSSCK